MSFEILIRTSLPGDLTQLKNIYSEAFPDEDLYPLVTELIKLDPDTLSLVLLINENVSGHVLFTRCEVEQANVLLLGPLLIKPEVQNKGLGSKLVREGMEQASLVYNASQFFVLGDPNYYGRFGFEADNNVETPCPIPEQWKPAWQSLNLNNAVPFPKGKLQVPVPWQKPQLWSDQA